MSMAAERRARVGAAVDRAWGETFLLSPQCRPPGDPDGRPAADPSRPAFAFVGRFMASSDQTHARSRASSLQTTKPFDTANATVTVSRDQLVSDVQESDQLLRSETGETFTVTRVMDGRFGRLVLILRSGPR